MKVRAAILHETGQPFSVEPLDLAPPKLGEVQVRMVAAGVCHSDWHIVTGATRHPLPVVAGHEGAGIVEAVGDNVSRVSVGDHVSLNWAPSCGQCYYCVRDRPSLCATFVGPVWAGTMLDGTTRLSQNAKPVYHFSSLACFAERIVTPEVCCVPMDRRVPLPIAALIGCAVTTGVGAVLNTANVPSGSSVLVVGAGGVGLSTVLGAAMVGASTIIVVDKSEPKRVLSKAFGATHALAPSDGFVEQVHELTDGRGVDFAFEAVGVADLQTECVRAVRPGGTVVLAGIPAADSFMSVSGAELIRKEKTIKGCYYGSSNPARDFPRFGELYLSGQLPLDRLISKTYALDDINAAYADMLSGDIARGLIKFE